MNRSIELRRLCYLLGGLGLVALYVPNAHALDPFVDASERLQNSALTSGVAIGVADMNADGLDDVVRLDDTQNLEIEYQQPDGSFVRANVGPTGTASWSIAIADFDRNGYPDIFTGGAYDSLVVLVANDDGTDYDRVTLDGPGTFVQCSSFSDIDNDGNLDLFVCHDDGLSRPFRNMGGGTLEYDTSILTAESTNPSDNSGNYGNVWSDFDGDGDTDLYIAKCRQGVSDPLDGRRLNLLFENDGNGNFVDVADAVGLRPQGQSWSADFADIDNDGDMDAIVLNHNYSGNDAPSELYENDGNVFTPITASAGIVADLEAVGTGIQNYFGDFDNDGFVDLLVTSGGAEHRFFANNGDNTFTANAVALPTGNLEIQSLAVGDLNNDGALDLIAGFANGFNQPTNNPDQLYLNSKNDNNWFKVRLTGTLSNRAAVGARVTLNGAWGSQTREVRAGESYGISHSPTRHFGLGQADAIESMVVTWPSGTVDTVKNPGINQTVELTEGCQTEFFPDADGDGFGAPGRSVVGCITPKGSVANSDDCNDDDDAINPRAEEICDDLDNNCNDEVDEGLDEICDPPPEGTTGGDTTGAPDPTADPSDPTTDPNDPTTDPDPTADPSGSSGGGDAGGNDDGGGCGCSASATRQDAFFFLMFFAMGTPWLRRRVTRG